MDGIVNLDKPLGLTSAKALDRVRWITRQRKSGHAGALDPLATGVLVLCMGRATKLVEAMMDQPKLYRTAARLDVTSVSLDLEADLEQVDGVQPPSRERVAHVLAGFEGAIDQVPPAMSAVKVRGQPAYKLSRSGRPPKLDPRRVEVYWIHLRRYAWPEVEFDVACGRGTYVRSLIRDIGVRLGTGGCLTALRRLAVGPFTADESWTLERLQDAGDVDAYLVPLDRCRALLAERPVRIPARPSVGANAESEGENRAAP